MLLLQLYARGQKLAITIDSVIVNPYDNTTFYFQLTIHNNDTIPVFLNKVELLKEHFSGFTEYVDSSSDNVYVKDWHLMEDFALKQYAQAWLYNDSILAIYRSFDKALLRKNKKLHSVKINGVKYYKLLPSAEIKPILHWNVLMNHIADVHFHLSDEQRKNLEASIYMIVQCYSKDGDKKFSFLLNNPTKFKEQLIKK